MKKTRVFLFLLLFPSLVYGYDCTPCTAVDSLSGTGGNPSTTCVSYNNNAYIFGAYYSSNESCGSSSNIDVGAWYIDAGAHLWHRTILGTINCTAPAVPVQDNVHAVSIQACSAPVDPAHCSNKSKDYDETGIDCGGSCSAQCVSKCPNGTTTLTQLSGPLGPIDTYGFCFAVTGRDAYGNCPMEGTNWFPATQNLNGVISKTCISLPQLPIMAADSVTAGNLPTFTPPPALAGGTLSVTTTTTSGNGSSTSTTTTSGDAGVGTGSGSGGAGSSSSSSSTTTTNGDGTTTTTTINNNSTAPEDNPGNYTMPNVPGENKYDGAKDSDKPEKKTINTLLNSWVNSSPLVGMVRSFTLTGSGSPVVTGVTVYGRSVDFDFTRYDATFQILGGILVLIVHGFAILVVVRGW